MRELMDTQRQNFWTEAIYKEGKKRLDWLSKNDRDQFDVLSSEAAALDDSWKVVTGKRHIQVPDKDDLLADVGGMATLKGTSANIVGSKLDNYELDEERYPKCQILQKFESKLPGSLVFPVPEDEEGNDLIITEPPPEMRPPSTVTKSLLYDGFSKEGRGRKQYLQARTTQKIPEERFDYTVTSNWEYGWQQSGQVKLAPPQFGRSRIVRETFFRTGGALKN